MPAPRADRMTTVMACPVPVRSASTSSKVATFSVVAPSIRRAKVVMPLASATLYRSMVTGKLGCLERNANESRWSRGKSPGDPENSALRVYPSARSPLARPTAGLDYHHSAPPIAIAITARAVPARHRSCGAPIDSVTASLSSVFDSAPTESARAASPGASVVACRLSDNVKASRSVKPIIADVMRIARRLHQAVTAATTIITIWKKTAICRAARNCSGEPSSPA